MNAGMPDFCSLLAAADASKLALDTPSVTYSLIRLAGALLLVCAVFFAGVWLFRNWQQLARPHGQAPKLSVLEARALGSRHALYVVGYEQQRFLLSSAPAGITLLTTLPPAAAETPRAPAPTFAETLARALAPRNGKAQ